MQIQSMPPQLQTSLGGEGVDFALSTNRPRPLWADLYTLFFSLVWLSAVLFIGSVTFGPLLQGQEVKMTINNVPTVVSPHNLQPLLLPVVFIGGFVLIGVVLL